MGRVASPASDWRWRRDRGDSPWYPTIRLFRQARLGDTLLAEVQIYAMATTPGTYTVTLDTGGNTFFYDGGTQVGAAQGDATGYMGMITALGFRPRAGFDRPGHDGRAPVRRLPGIPPSHSPRQAVSA